MLHTPPPPLARPFIEECLAKMLLFERLEPAGQKRVVQEMYRCGRRLSRLQRRCSCQVILLRAGEEAPHVC